MGPNYIDDWLRRQGYGGGDIGAGGSGAPDNFDATLNKIGYGEKSPVQNFDVPQTGEPFGGHYVSPEELAALNARRDAPLSPEPTPVPQPITPPTVPPIAPVSPQTASAAPETAMPSPQQQDTTANASGIALPTTEDMLEVFGKQVKQKDLMDWAAKNFLDTTQFGMTLKAFGVDTPEELFTVPGMGGTFKAISDIFRPTQTGHLSDIPAILSGQWQDPSAWNRVVNSELGFIGGVTGELRDLPVLGPLYRALVEVPANVFNEATIQTGGARALAGNAIGLPISDVLSQDGDAGSAARMTFRQMLPGLAIPLTLMFGEKMGFEDPNRFAKYTAQLDEEARKVAMNSEPDATSYLGAAWNKTDPTTQLFLGLTDPLNMIDIYPFSSFTKLRAAKRATADLAAMPRAMRMLYGLPEQLVDEAGNPLLVPAEKLGIKKPSTWEKLMPTNLTKNSRAYDMLNRALDRVNSILPDQTPEQFKEFFKQVSESAKSGKLQKEFLQQHPGMNSVDANLAVQLTGQFDVDGAIKRVDGRRAIAEKILSGEESAPKVGSKIWDNAIESLRKNKNLDAKAVLDTAEKYDLQSQWSLHIAKGIRDTLGITDPGVIRKFVNSVRAWEGAFYIGMNPGSWVRNGMSNMGAMYVHGFTPWDNVDKIEATYKAIGWNPLGELMGLDVMNAAGQAATNSPGARGAFGAELPKRLGRLITVNEQIENASRKIIMYRAMDYWLKQNHTRGRAFKRMPVELENSLKAIHPRYPDLIYGAIEQNIDAASIAQAVENSLTHYKIQSFFEIPEFRQELGAALGADGNVTTDHVRAWMARNVDRLNEAIAKARETAANSKGTVSFEQALSDEFDSVLREATDHAEKLRVRDAEMRDAFQQAVGRNGNGPQTPPPPASPAAPTGPQTPPSAPTGGTPLNQSPVAPGTSSVPTDMELRIKVQEIVNAEERVTPGMLQRRLKITRAEADAMLSDLAAQGVIEKDPKSNSWVKASPKQISSATPEEIDAWIDEYTAMGAKKDVDPDAQQFYDNNVDAIEARIKERSVQTLPPRDENGRLPGLLPNTPVEVASLPDDAQGEMLDRLLNGIEDHIGRSLSADEGNVVIEELLAGNVSPREIADAVKEGRPIFETASGGSVSPSAEVADAEAMIESVGTDVTDVTGTATGIQASGENVATTGEAAQGAVLDDKQLADALAPERPFRETLGKEGQAVWDMLGGSPGGDSDAFTKSFTDIYNAGKEGKPFPYADYESTASTQAIHKAGAMDAQKTSAPADALSPGDPNYYGKIIPEHYRYDEVEARFQLFENDPISRFTSRDDLKDVNDMDLSDMSEGEIKWWENNATEMGMLVSEINRVENAYPVKKRTDAVNNYLAELNARLDEMEAERTAAASENPSPENVKIVAALENVVPGTDKWKIASTQSHNELRDLIDRAFSIATHESGDFGVGSAAMEIDEAIRMARRSRANNEVFNLAHIEDAIRAKYGELDEVKSDALDEILGNVQSGALSDAALSTDLFITSKPAKDAYDEFSRFLSEQGNEQFTINFPEESPTNEGNLIQIEDSSGNVVFEQRVKLTDTPLVQVEDAIENLVDLHNVGALRKRIEAFVDGQMTLEDAGKAAPQVNSPVEGQLTPSESGAALAIKPLEGDIISPSEARQAEIIQQLKDNGFEIVAGALPDGFESIDSYVAWSLDNDGTRTETFVYVGNLTDGSEIRFESDIELDDAEVSRRLEGMRLAGEIEEPGQIPAEIGTPDKAIVASVPTEQAAPAQAPITIPDPVVSQVNQVARDTENPYRVTVKGGDGTTTISAIGKGPTEEEAHANALAEFEKLWRKMMEQRNAKGQTLSAVPVGEIKPSTSWSQFTEEQWFESLVNAIQKKTPVNFYHETIFGSLEKKIDGWHTRYHRALGETDAQISGARYGRLKQIYEGGVVPNGRKDIVTNAKLNAYVLEDLIPRIRKDTPELAAEIAAEMDARARIVWNKFLNGEYAQYGKQVNLSMFERVRDAEAIIQMLSGNEKGLDLTSLRGYSFDIEQKLRGGDVQSTNRPGITGTIADAADNAGINAADNAGINAADNAAAGTDGAADTNTTGASVSGNADSGVSTTDSRAGASPDGAEGVRGATGATGGNGDVSRSPTAEPSADAAGNVAAGFKRGDFVTYLGESYRVKVARGDKLWIENTRDARKQYVSVSIADVTRIENGLEGLIGPQQLSNFTGKYVLTKDKNVKVGDWFLNSDGYVFRVKEVTEKGGIVFEVENQGSVFTMQARKSDIRGRLDPIEGSTGNVTNESAGIGTPESASGLGQSETPPTTVGGDAGMVDGTIPGSGQEVGGGLSSEPTQPGSGVGETSGAARGNGGRGALDGAPGNTNANGTPVPTDAPTANGGTGLVGGGPGAVTGSAPNRGNDYVITDNDIFAVGGKKTRYKQNVEAIRLLRKIESEGRLATPQEQAVLVKYVGWGGIKEVFDFNKGEWDKEAHELKDLLSPEEYRAARSSMLNAHYTERRIISRMWEAVRRLGFKGGNVLEPSIGIGHFFGLMPLDLVNNPATRRVGVDLDSISARIAMQLYQNAKIYNAGFERAPIPDNFFRVSITNVPFLEIGPTDKRFANKPYLTENLHNYFFAKALDKLEPGGIIAFITSRYTMDGVEDSAIKFRKYMAENAELIAAYRLPENAFEKNAGTTVTTDVLFLRKRGAANAPELPESKWLEPAYYKGKGFKINEYYVKHPENMFGEMGWRDGGRYGDEAEIALLATDGADIDEMFADAINQLPENILPDEVKAPSQMTTQELLDRMNATRRRENAYFIDENGDLKYQKGGEATDPRVGKKNEERVKGMVRLRDAYRETLAVYANKDATDAMIKNAQRLLKEQYDDFVKQYGVLHSDENSRLFARDVERGVLFGLESKHPHTGEWVKSDMFTKRTIGGAKQVKADTPVDALSAVLSERGYVDFGRMSELLGTPVAELQADLLGHVYRDPKSGTWQIAEEYLSGNVRQKLVQAEQAAAIDPAYQFNVDKLKQVQPRDLAPGEIDARLGSTWIPASDVEEFLNHLIDGNGAVVTKSATNDWHVEEGSGSPTRIWQTFGAGIDDQGNTIDYSVYKALNDILNRRKPKIFDEVPIVENGIDTGRTRKVLNKKKTEAAFDAMKRVQDEFQKWIWSDVDRANRLSAEYNQTFNSLVLRKYEGKHYQLNGIPGLTPDLQPNLVPGKGLKPHQISAIWRVLSSGNSLLAHPVGAGKSFEMAGIAMEARRLGIAKKILVVAADGQVPNLANQFRTAFPGMNLLVVNKRDFDPGGRAAFLAQMAAGDYDVVMMQHSQLKQIPVKAESFNRFANKTLQELQESLDAALARRERRNVRDIEKEIRRVQEKINKRISNLQEVQDDILRFEDLGVDMMMVDEAHEFKNLYFPTKMKEVKGINHSDSDQAFDMLVKSSMVNEESNYRGMIFATATPIANSIAETFVQMKFLAPMMLDRHGLRQFDEWAANFGETVTMPEFGIDGQSLKSVERFSRFLNVPELSRMFNSFTDIITTDELLKNGYIKLPKLANGMPTNKVIQPPQEILDIMADIKRILEDARAHPKEYKGHAADLVQATRGRKASLDLRLVDPRYPDLPDSKLNQMIREVKRLYDESGKHKGTQLIFSDLGAPQAKVSIPDEKLARRASRMLARPWQESTPWAVEDRMKILTEQGIYRVNESDLMIYNTKTGKPVVAETIVKRRKGKAPETIPNPQYEKWQEMLHDLQDAGVDLKAHLTAVAGKMWQLKSEQRFQLFPEIKKKLIEMGVPKEQIAIINDFDGNVKRAELYEKMNSGEIRVLIGSRDKMGLGMNVQERVYATHHLDVPWRPDWLEQSNGRMMRQGNMFEALGIPVHEIRWIQEKGFDTYMWQTVKWKMDAIYRFMKGEIVERHLDDVSAAELSAAESLAIATGNPLALERFRVEGELARIYAGFARYQNNLVSMRQRLAILPEDIARWTREQNYYTGLKTNAESFGKDFGITLGENTFDERNAAGQWIMDRAAELRQTAFVMQKEQKLRVGTYKGFELVLNVDTGQLNTGAMLLFDPNTQSAKTGKYAWVEAIGTSAISDSPEGNTRKLDNIIKGLDAKIIDLTETIRRGNSEIDYLNEQINTPYAEEPRMRELEKKKAEIDDALGLNKEKEDARNQILPDDDEDDAGELGGGPGVPGTPLLSAAAGLGGFEQDEDGEWKFNPEKAALLIGATMLGGKALSSIRSGELPLSGYIGNKRTMLKAGAYDGVVPENVSFRRIVDAFGGSGLLSSAFQKLTGAPRVVNDLSDDIVNFHRVAQSNPSDLILLVRQMRDAIVPIIEANPDGGTQATAQAKQAWDTLMQQFARGDETQRAAGTFLSHNGSVSGMDGSPRFYRKDGTWRISGKTFDRLEERIRNHTASLQDAVVSQADARQLLKDAEPGELVLLDPPYVNTSVSYGHGDDLASVEGALKFINEDMAAAQRRGVPMIYSNNYDPALEKALKKLGFETKQVQISGNAGATRTELLAWNKAASGAPYVLAPIAGFEQDEDGEWVYSPEKGMFAAGAVLGVGGLSKLSTNKMFRRALGRWSHLPAEAGPQVADAAANEAEMLSKILPVVQKYVLDTDAKPGRALAASDPLAAQELEKYLKGQVYPTLADTRSIATQMGHDAIRRTVLDYNRRHNYDDWLSYIFPFMYWRTENAKNWLKLAVQRPALTQNYLRAQETLSQDNDDGRPKRLYGKMKVAAPFLEDWMGGSVYFEPYEPFFPMKSIFASEAQKAKWGAGGVLGFPPSDDEIANTLRAMAQRGEIERGAVENAIATKSGNLWEIGKLQTQQGNNPTDSLGELFSPHAPLQWLAAAYTDGGASIGPLLPISRNIRQMTGMLGMNNGEGVNVESPVRALLRNVLPNLPEFDPFEEYRVRRMLANMVENNELSAKDAKLAMLEKSGKWWGEASRRANAEKIPFLNPAIPIQTFPTGEQGIIRAQTQLRILKQNEVRRLGGEPSNMTSGEIEEYLKSHGGYGEGTALSQFYDVHPELDARSAVFQQDEELLKKWLVDEIWTKYKGASALDKRAIRSQLGDEFQTYFYNPRTHDYDKVDLLDMIRWGQRIDAIIPNIPKGEIETLDLARLEAQDKIRFAPPDMAQRYDAFLQKMNATFPQDQMDELQAEFDELESADDRKDFYKRNPEFQAFKQAWSKFYDSNADIKDFLIAAGAMTPTATLAGADQSQAAKFYNAAIAAGIDWEDAKAKQDIYETLPVGTGARTKFLQDPKNANYKRYYDMRNLFFPKEQTANYGSGNGGGGTDKVAKQYDPQDYIYPQREKRLPRGGDYITYWGSADMYKALAAARKRFYERQQKQAQQGEFRPDTQTRNSPKIG